MIEQHNAMIESDYDRDCSMEMLMQTMIEHTQSGGGYRPWSWGPFRIFSTFRENLYLLRVRRYLPTVMLNN